MKIYNITTHREIQKLPTSSGEKTRKTFRWEMDKNTGVKELVLDEEINIQDEIESYHEETKIENIIRRATFDPSFAERLGAPQGDGAIVDVVNMPGTLAEAQQLMIDVEQTWNKLPAEIKQKFNNDIDMYIHTYGTTEWANALGWIKESISNKSVKEEETIET